MPTFRLPEARPERQLAAARGAERPPATTSGAERPRATSSSGQPRTGTPEERLRHHDLVNVFAVKTETLQTEAGSFMQLIVVGKRRCTPHESSARPRVESDAQRGPCNPEGREFNPKLAASEPAPRIPALLGS